MNTRFIALAALAAALVIGPAKDTIAAIDIPPHPLTNKIRDIQDIKEQLKEQPCTGFEWPTEKESLSTLLDQNHGEANIDAGTKERLRSAVVDTRDADGFCSNVLPNRDSLCPECVGRNYDCSCYDYESALQRAFFVFETHLGE